MLQLCCTEKLLKEFRLTKARAPRPDKNAQPLTQWYAHLFYVAGRKCVAIVNPLTGWALYKVFMNREGINQIPQHMSNMIGFSLIEHGFNQEVVAKALEGIEDTTVCRTNNASALAVLNQQIYCLPVEWPFAPGTTTLDVELTWAMVQNFGPCAGSYRFAYEEMANLLGVSVPRQMEVHDYVKAYKIPFRINLDASGNPIL